MKKFNKFIAEVAMPSNKMDMEFRKLAFGKIGKFEVTSDSYDGPMTKKDQSEKASREPSDTEKKTRKYLDAIFNDLDSHKLEHKDKSYKFKVYEDVMDVKLTYSALISEMLNEIHELVETATDVNISNVTEADGILSGPSPDWKGLYRQLEDVRDTLLAYVPTQEDEPEHEEDEDMFESTNLQEISKERLGKYIKNESIAGKLASMMVSKNKNYNLKFSNGKSIELTGNDAKNVIKIMDKKHCKTPEELISQIKAEAGKDGIVFFNELIKKIETLKEDIYANKKNKREIGFDKAVDKLVKEEIIESFKPGALKLEDGNVFSLNKKDVDALNSMLEMMDNESKSEMCKKAKKNKKELHDMIIFSHDLSKLK